MDAIGWGLALAAGAGAGGLCGLLPGFHTNTLAALLLALAPAAGEWGAMALLAAASAHAFVSILPSTYVGVPGEDSTLSVLPAHRLLAEGNGAQAVRIAADAVLAATVLAVLLLLPFKWLMEEPVRVLEVLDAAVPWILGGVLVLLLAQERRRGWTAVGAAIVCMGAAAGIGWMSNGMRLTALVPIPATPLLPLLSGLFGAAGLVHSLASGTRFPEQLPSAAPMARTVRRGIASACFRGVAAAGWTAALPGLTSAVGASVALAGARSEERDPRRALACMNAVGAAHQVFALGMLWLTLRARTGTAIAVQDLVDVQEWQVGRPPEAMLAALAMVVAAAALGYVVTLRLDRATSHRLMRLDGRRVSMAALGFLALLVLALSGPTGLLLLCAAATVGLLPIAFGVRRVHLTAALIVPILLARFGFTA